MSEKKIEDTKFFSKKIGKLAKGCRQCVKGEKLVLFVTGLCPRSCWYCPLSEKKKDIDVIYANEWKITSQKDIIKEAQLTDAKGAGITGGDPLAKLSRTCKLIEKLKKEFGEEFHIHLYTSLDLVTKERLKKLSDAGLDEIRFHPRLKNDKLWKKIELAFPYQWDVGIEIPVIPGRLKETKKLINSISGKVDFLNLNELEVTETNIEDFDKRNLKTRNKVTQAIKGSAEMANKLLQYSLDKRLNVHFCTSKLKDSVQMKNRIKRRAENVATDFDLITDEGLLLRSVVYPNTKKSKNTLNNMKIKFIEDKKKKRLMISPENIESKYEEIKKRGLKPALVEQYPTWDELDINIDFL